MMCTDIRDPTMTSVIMFLLILFLYIYFAVRFWNVSSLKIQIEGNSIKISKRKDKIKITKRVQPLNFCLTKTGICAFSFNNNLTQLRHIQMYIWFFALYTYHVFLVSQLFSPRLCLFLILIRNRIFFASLNLNQENCIIIIIE